MKLISLASVFTPFGHTIQSAALDFSILDICEISETISREAVSRDYTINDTLFLSETFHPEIVIEIIFDTLGNEYYVPDIQNLTIFPYNYIQPIYYADTDYTFADLDNLSIVCLFQLNMSLTLEQRREFSRYFTYWIGNLFHIYIKDDVWEGHLTQNNQILNVDQFHEGADVVIEFEAIKVN